MGAGGATTFCFERGQTGQMEVHSWKMTIQGPLERILDSVLPHEISHTIFACHFRRPLPRWADEGAATLAENDSERQRQRVRAYQVLQNGQRIPLKTLFSITEYPADMDEVLTLYAQGYSLAEYLIQRGGKTRYLRFVAHALQNGWDEAIRSHYGLRGASDLESRWSGWVMAGSPNAPRPAGQLVAKHETGTTHNKPDTQPVVRSQSPEPIKPIPRWRVRPKVTVAASLPVSDHTRPSNATPVIKAAGHSRLMRGEGLHAPDPRTVSKDWSRQTNTTARQLLDVPLMKYERKESSQSLTSGGRSNRLKLLSPSFVSP